MISLADFEPLSVAKINIVFINNGGFTRKIFQWQSHSFEEVPVQTMLRDGDSFRRLAS